MIAGNSCAARSARFPKYRLLPALCLAAGLLLTAGTAFAQQCGGSSIGSNFNGTAIDGGNFVWFNAVVKVTGVDVSNGTLIELLGSTIAFTAGGTTYQLDVPATFLEFVPGATEAETQFVDGAWVTVVPATFSQEVFLSGLAFQVPAGGLSGGINPVTWSGTFLSPTTAGVKVQWKWAAAVYTQFSTDPTAIEVKPVDGNTENPFANSDHAGTPENFKAFVIGGARGGGGSNWTGSYSGTAAVGVCYIPQE